MSVVEQTLRTDPAGVYPAMDFATRDRYRHAVEEIAKRSQISEEDVARKAAELAASSSGNGRANGWAGHIGYFLVDGGRRTLERAAHARPTVAIVLRRLARQVPMSAYIGSLLLLTALATALVTAWGARHGLSTSTLIASGLLVAI